jgi:hypothetical protein
MRAMADGIVLSLHERIRRRNLQLTQGMSDWEAKAFIARKLEEAIAKIPSEYFEAVQAETDLPDAWVVQQEWNS